MLSKEEILLKSGYSNWKHLQRAFQIWIQEQGIETTEKSPEEIIELFLLSKIDTNTFKRNSKYKDKL